MQEKELRTSTKQRIVIIVIAILTLVSTILAYLLIVLAGNKSENNVADDPELVALEEEYNAKQSEYNEYSATLASQYFDEFNSYRSQVKAYNATTANSDGLKTVDLKEGTGRELAEDDTDYFAYYIGWCADESVFDSSFNDSDSPTTLNAPLYAGVGLIEGWNQGVLGMKIGGVREISIPAELAYGDTQEICGGTNSPLKFIVMPITDEQLSNLNNELEEIYGRMYAKYMSNAGDSVEVTE